MFSGRHIQSCIAVHRKYLVHSDSSLKIMFSVLCWFTLIGSIASRDCGQAEVDARDISGCITVLHMSYLGHTGAVWLGDALHHNVNLETLDLHHTKIGDDDAYSLAAGLQNNTHLKRLRTGLPLPLPCLLCATSGTASGTQRTSLSRLQRCTITRFSTLAPLRLDAHY